MQAMANEFPNVVGCARQSRFRARRARLVKYSLCLPQPGTSFSAWPPAGTPCPFCNTHFTARTSPMVMRFFSLRLPSRRSRLMAIWPPPGPRPLSPLVRFVKLVRSMLKPFFPEDPDPEGGTSTSTTRFSSSRFRSRSFTSSTPGTGGCDAADEAPAPPLAALEGVDVEGDTDGLPGAVPVESGALAALG